MSSTNDAMSIARRARQERIDSDPDEIARRERERDERDRIAAAANRRERDDADLLAASPLGSWFPGAEWAVEGHYRGGTLFGTGPRGQGGHLSLLVTPKFGDVAINPSSFEVRFAEAEDGDKASDDLGRARGAIMRHGAWKGEVVRSPADVGDCIERNDAVFRSMPAHLP